MTAKQNPPDENPVFASEQPCVKSILNSELPAKIKVEMNKFISRNIIKECGRVAPNCLKAHLIKTAKAHGFPEEKINSLKKLFKSKVGFNGYYLDAGKLKRV